MGTCHAQRAMQRWQQRVGMGIVGIVLALALEVSGQDKAMEEILKYRQMLQEGNPAELVEARGEELWKTPRGPKNVSLEQCDLGLGPGIVAGAYAQLPRYFADTGQVQDVESRLVTCMTTLQGLTTAEATQGWYKPESTIEALVTYIATHSKGQKIAVPATHPKEAELYQVGERLFYRRSGPLDFACSTCHGQPDKRIRLQDLPELATPQGAQASMVTWPAYRVSQGNVWTMERRLIDCARQMRFPEPDYLSEAMIALQVFMQKNASGAVMEAPGIKR